MKPFRPYSTTGPVRSAERGYIPPETLSSQIRAMSAPKLSLALAAAFQDYALILACGSISFFLVGRGWWWIFVLALPANLILAGRSLRGLECLVHEASHFNFTRERRRNDWIANLLCAWPVLSEVERYRNSHFFHHRSFSHSEDPDRVRHEALSLQLLDRSSLIAFSKGIILRVIPYIPGWWWAIGLDKTTVLRFIIWHSAFVIGLMLSVFSISEALLFWILAWGVPFFFILPIVRFVAEAAEHDYSNLDSDGAIFSRTWSNIGTIHQYLFHPHNDGYHTIHHLYPAVPHHALKKVHELLTRGDAIFASGSLIRVRVTEGGDACVPHNSLRADEVVGG